MAGIIAFHVLMLLLALGIATHAVSTHSVSTMLSYLHQSIGITTPPTEQVRMIALIWIGSTVIVVDGCLFLTVLIASLSQAAR